MALIPGLARGREAKMARRRAAATAEQRPRVDRGRTAVVDCGVYAHGERREDAASYPEALRRARAEGGFVWIGLHEPSARELDDIARDFGLHALAVEDAVQAHQRPKLEKYEGMLFAVFKTVNYVAHETVTDSSQIVETGEVMVFVGEDYVVTVRHGDHGSLRGLRRRIENDQALMSIGPLGVLYAIADRIVDDYLGVTAAVQDDVDEIEQSVLSPERTRGIERIYQLKREVIELKRAVAPLEMPMRDLVTRYSIGHGDLTQYFRDVEDHLTRVRDQVTGYDELLTSILQVASRRCRSTRTRTCARSRRGWPSPRCPR